MVPRTPLTRRQRDILEFFRHYADDQGISPTLEEIAQHFGLSKVTIFGHVAELERKGVIERTAPGISRGLVLVEDADPGRPSDLPPSAVSPSPGLPILGTIAAGVPISTLENPEELRFEDWAPPGKDVYVLRVQGDSMIDDSIRDGDLVVVERRTDPSPGETVVAVLPDEEATLKRYYPEHDGRIRLQPANTLMEPIFVPAPSADEPGLEIRGVVIGVLRRY